MINCENKVIFANKFDLKKLLNKVNIKTVKTINAATGINAVLFHFAVIIPAAERTGFLAALISDAGLISGRKHRQTVGLLQPCIPT